MKTQKVTITIPGDLLAVVDLLSKERGMSRSKFISTVIREKIPDERNRHLKEAYDRVFRGERIRKEQLETALWYRAVQSDEGQEW